MQLWYAIRFVEKATWETPRTVCLFVFVLKTLHGCWHAIISDPKTNTRNDTTRTRVATSRENTCATISIHITLKKICDKSSASHYDICCYCIASGSRERHANTQWTCFFFVSDVKLERFDDKMGTAHKSSFFTVTSSLLHLHGRRDERTVLSLPHTTDHHCRDGRGCVALGRENKSYIFEK